MFTLLLFLLGCEEATTQGEACETLGSTSCERLLECNLTFTDAELCIDQVVGACCEDEGTCDETADAAVLTCTVDVGIATCEELEESFPSSCGSLL